MQSRWAGRAGGEWGRAEGAGQWHRTSTQRTGMQVSGGCTVWTPGLSPPEPLLQRRDETFSLSHPASHALSPARRVEAPTLGSGMKSQRSPASPGAMGAFLTRGQQEAGPVCVPTMARCLGQFRESVGASCRPLAIRSEPGCGQGCVGRWARPEAPCIPGEAVPTHSAGAPGAQHKGDEGFSGLGTHETRRPAS